MKNCASCSKELPDAALHCVFCGAKQAAAPLNQGGVAKTVMGYSGQEVEQLRQQQLRGAGAALARQPAPATEHARDEGSFDDHDHATVLEPSMAAFAAAATGPQNAIRDDSPRNRNPGPTPANPMAAAQAKTMMAPSPVAGLAAPAGGFQPPQPASPAPIGGGFQPPAPAPIGGGFQPPAPAPIGGGYQPPQPAPMGGYQPPQPAPMGGYQPPQPAPMGGYQPPQPAPAAPIPQYLASQTAARAGRPIEPWKDALRLIMFVWGGLLLAAFATPLSLEPMTFNWDVVLEAPGKAKLGPLVLAATGLLSIVIGAIPLAAAARGAIALVLGLAGVFVPMLILGMPPWQGLVQAVGVLLLVGGLLARHEYRDAVLPRVVVTVGAVAGLLPYVIPSGDGIPVVQMIKAVIDAPGATKVLAILFVVHVLVLALALLAWLPAPASGAAKPLAWVLILFPLAVHAGFLFLLGDPSMVEKTPYQGAMRWIAGGGGDPDAMIPGALGLGVAYLAITGYGLATVLGKKLE